ncbi:MAG TPA: hypothetical protein VFV99_33860 [Kofleriaceae bacterium]|nr:hypothetical protein [Kofleriaceae bacterium]
MSDERTKAGFWHGVFAGFCGFIMVVQLAIASQLSDVASMYRDFGDVKLPVLTRLTIHPAWTWGTSLLGIGAVAALVVKRPRSIALYVATAVVLLAVAIATYWYPRAPIYALAGNISAD